jgi:NAD(P)-dependent dehydrogenase (short-subunit alcohol dehydrogenase family)
VVVVTGGARGIGDAIIVAFLAHGARAVSIDLGDPEEPRERTRYLQADVGSLEAVEAAFADIDAHEGRVDVLVNNAGILLREGIDTPDAHRKIRRVFDVNVMGGFNVLHAFLPALRQTRGCVINIASGAAFIAQAGCIGYSGSKGAVKMLTQSMAVDLAPDGIRVNAIAPGVIDTAMTDATRADPQRLQGFLRRTPLGRVGRPEEIAEPALFLASAMASYITGVTLPVDGGVLAA